MTNSTKYSGRGAAFLLILPGAALAGFGLGLAFNEPLPWALVGGGLGSVLWGLIVALSAKFNSNL